MSALHIYAHTRGPWAWNESQHCLRAAVPDPSPSAVHTVVELAHAYSGYVGSERAATQREGDANLQLILQAPCTLDALHTAFEALLHAKGMLATLLGATAPVPALLQNAIDDVRAALAAATATPQLAKVAA